MVARAQWACEVSQGSVKTLFRWGGKCLYDFAANLFRKLCAKFHQNGVSFIEDITKKRFGLFFSGCSIYYCYYYYYYYAFDKLCSESASLVDFCLWILLYEGRPINKLQNGIILLIFKI